MSLLILVHPLLELLKLQFIVILCNHMVNIPLSLFLGLGKYIAFAIALVMDVAQMVLYYNVLNHTVMEKRLSWAVDEKLYKNYRQPAFMRRLHKSWKYAGVMFLSLLPIYFGGLFAAMLTAHLMRLNKKKSLTAIFLGSLVGCYIWTIGLWSVIGVAAGFIKKIL
jgi:uncharacterized membrane protein